MKATFFIAILLFTTTIVHAATPTPSETPSIKPDPIIEALKNIVIKLPTINSSSIIPGVDMAILNGSCNGIFVGAVTSSYIAPTFSAGITGLGINCTANFSYKQAAWPYIQDSGSVSLLLQNGGASFSASFNSSRITLTSCNVDIPDITLKFYGGKTAAILNLYVDEIVEMVDLLLLGVCPMIKPVIENDLTSVYQLFQSIILPWDNDHQLDPTPEAPAAAVPWEASWLLGLVSAEANDLLSVSTINRVVNAFTNSTGAFVINSSQFPSNIPRNITMPIAGTDITIGINSLLISGLNTFTGDKWLTPLANNQIHLDFDMSKLNMKLAFYVEVKKNGAVKGLLEQATLEIDLANLDFDAAAQLLINMPQLYALTFEDLINIKCSGSSLTDIDFTLTSLNFIVPLFQLSSQTGQFESEIFNLINNFMNMITTTFAPSMSATLNMFLDGMLRPQINTLLDVTLRESALGVATCSKAVQTAALMAPMTPGKTIPTTTQTHQEVHSHITQKRSLASMFLQSDPSDAELKAMILGFMNAIQSSSMPDLATLGYSSYDASPTAQLNSQATWIPFIPVGLAIFAVIAFGIWWEMKRKETLPDDKKSWILESRNVDSLFFSISIPVIWRICIPVALLLNLALLVSSVGSTASSVFGFITVSDKPFSINSLYDFGFINSLVSIFNQGAYFLIIYVILLSGCWPFGKILISLGCWFLPTRILSLRLRDISLTVVDSLGKFALANVFVIGLLVPINYLNLQTPLTSSAFAATAPTGTIGLEIIIKLQYGILSFLGNVMVMLFLGSVQQYWNRRAINSFILNMEKDTSEKSAISSRPWHCGNMTVRLTVVGRVLVAALLLVTFALIIASLVVDTLQISYSGGLTNVFPWMNQPTTVNYSLASLLGRIGDANFQGDNNVLNHWYMVMIFIFGFGFPLLSISLMFLVWCLPMSKPMQRISYGVCECVSSVSAFKVLIISICALISGCWAFSNVTLQQVCTPLQPVWAEMGTENCLQINLNFIGANGAGILITGLLVNFFAVVSFLMVTHRAMIYNTNIDSTQESKLKNTESSVSFKMLSKLGLVEAIVLDTPSTKNAMEVQTVTEKNMSQTIPTLVIEANNKANIEMNQVETKNEVTIEMMQLETTKNEVEQETEAKC